MLAPTISRNEALIGVQSDLFGEISVPEDAILSFPTGIYGFEDFRSYILVEAQLPGFFWLQSTDRSSLLFLLVDPFAHADDYAIDLDSGTREALGAAHSEDVAILSIVTLPHDESEEATFNLRGPIAINMATRLARQLVLDDPRWGVRQALDLEALAEPDAE